MYCKTCGKEINDNAVICPNCGCETGKVQQTQKAEDAPSFGYGLLGFLIPIVGLIMFLVWKNDYPLRAKSVGKGALISVIISVVFSIIYGIIVGAALGSMSYYY